jgi:transglutaminase-like putative cysteine protease
MDERKAKYLMVGASLVALTGAVLIIRHRRKQGSQTGEARLLGRSSKKSVAQGSVTSNGKTLKHYRSERMSIKERVGILQDLTHKSVQDPEMRKLALRITQHCKARDGECEARAIYDWTKRNVRYTGDIGPHKLGRHGPVEGIDLFQTAARTAEFRGGDCDDHSILNCTLALHNGLACKYRISSPTKKNNEDYSHIYAMAGLPKNSPNKWIALDTTLEHGKYGSEAPAGKVLDFVA